MPQPHMPWSDLLEEEAYLVQMVSETAHDPGALEQTSAILEILGADLKSCVAKVSDLERAIRDNYPKGSPKSSSASRFFHRITESISSDHLHEEKEHDYDALNGRYLDATTKKRTLRVEIRNLEVKAQVLRRRIRHHEELKQRLKVLYEKIFNGPNPASPEEDDAEEEVQNAKRKLHKIQQTTERHRNLTALLSHGDFALSNASPHLSAASKGTDQAAFQAEVIAAKACAVQAYVVVDQAKRLDPAFFEQEKGGNKFKTDWLSDVFRPQATGNGDPQHSTQFPSQQALQSYHTALLSLVSLARRRLQEYDASLRRAGQWYTEAFGRKHTLRRRVLLQYAGVDGRPKSLEERSLADMESSRGGLARIGNVTDGLDKLISIVAPSGLTIPQSEATDGRRRVEGEKKLPSRDQSLGRSQDIATQSTQLRPLTPSSMQRASSPNASPDPRVQGSPRGAPDDMASRQRDASSRELPSRPQRPDARALPQSHALGPNDSRPSFDGGSSDPRATARYGPPRPPPTQSAPPAPSSGMGELRAREARPSPQALSPQPLQAGQPRPRAQSTSAEAPTNSRTPPQSLSSNVRSEGVGPHAEYGRGSPEIVQSRSNTPTTQPAKRTGGILKTPTVPPPPPATDLTDPWGVKIATAGPSRPRPKLKNMISMLRGVDGFKNANNHTSDAGSTSSLGPGPSAQDSATVIRNISTKSKWTTLQQLRFSEEVVVIPRPAVDSDPYEDEQEDEIMPPSPTRGSMIWRSNEGEMDESEEGSDRRPTEAHHQTAGGTRKLTNASIAGSSSYPSEGPSLNLGSAGLPSLEFESDYNLADFTPQWHETTTTSRNPLLSADTNERQHPRHVTLERGSEDGARYSNQGDRQRRGPVTPNTGNRALNAAPVGQPDQLRAGRPLPDPGRTASDDIRVESHKASRTLAVLEDDVRGRFRSPSDPNLVEASRLAPQKPLMTRTRVPLEARSDHDLVQSMFPSPPSTVAERDLLFTN